MRYAAGLVIALAACTTTTGSPTSTEQLTVPVTVDLPCVSVDGVMSGDTSVTVQTGDQEVAAAMGWLSYAPCTDDGAGVVSDGFFAGLEDAVLTMDGEALRVVAPAFDQADLEAVWNGSDPSESPAVVTKTGAGTWEISDGPPSNGTHVLNLRFEYGEDTDAAFAVTVELQG